MAAGTITHFDEFKRWCFDDGIPLDNGNIKVALFAQTLTPNAATQSVLADIVAHELSHASYTAGGVALVSPAVSRSGGVGKFTSNGISIPFTGTDAAAKWAVFYMDAAVGALTDPLIAYVDLETTQAELVISAGYAFILNQPAAGWFTWS